MKEALSQNGVKFAYLDVTESLRNLVMFMNLRENHEAFADIKKEKYVGLPSIVVDDGKQVYFDLEEFDINELLK